MSQSIPFAKFGSLTLVSDVEEVGSEQASSCLNVAVDRDGRLRSRDGFDVLYDSGAAGIVSAIHPVEASSVLVADSGEKVRAIDIVGAVGSSVADVALTSGTSSFASTDDAVYFTDTTAAQVRKYSGGAFSSPAGLAGLEANYLAVQPLDDRLVIADANNTSLLRFSDVATPETFGANTLELTPGDGEKITGMCVFGTELFVFKRTKFFIFYGNSTDSTGGAVFNYRMVDTGIGCDSSSNSEKFTATHETGVYFLGYDGVYRTTGGPPIKISQAIAPVFKGTNQPIPAPFSSTLSAPVQAWLNVAVARDRLYVIGRDTAEVEFNQYVQFEMDLATGAWTVNNMPVVSVLDGSLLADATDADDYRGAVMMGGQATSDDHAILMKSSRAYTDDNGTAISWHYQSGFYDLGSQDSKRTRETVVWGSGSPTVSVFTDHGSTDANATAVTLGTAPAVARGWHRKAYQGVLFSHKLSGTAAATIHWIGHTVADARQGR